VLGLLFGWLFGLFNWIDPVVASFSLAFYGLVFGAVVGALLGLLTHAMTGGRREFASVSGMQASRYDVLWMRRSPFRPSRSWLNTRLAAPSLSCPQLPVPATEVTWSCRPEGSFPSSRSGSSTASYAERPRAGPVRPGGDYPGRHS
jgi:hypothetical protein